MQLRHVARCFSAISVYHDFSFRWSIRLWCNHEAKFFAAVPRSRDFQNPPLWKNVTHVAGIRVRGGLRSLSRALSMETYVKPRREEERPDGLHCRPGAAILKGNRDFGGLAAYER